MPGAVRVLVLIAAASLCACSQAATAEQESAPDLSRCESPETGLIKPGSTGMPDAPLKGPFVLKSLNAVVDPANPVRNGVLFWSKEEAWFEVSNFQGPLYIAEGETLGARATLSPWKTIYSGCRLQ